LHAVQWQTLLLLMLSNRCAVQMEGSSFSSRSTLMPHMHAMQITEAAAAAATAAAEAAIAAG
jgi:hypothetical protein